MKVEKGSVEKRFGGRWRGVRKANQGVIDKGHYTCINL